MKIMLVTDAWRPQVNGVVRTYENVISHIERNGTHKFEIIEPSLFATATLPAYPEVKMVLQPWKVGGMLKDAAFDAIHIATEGPLGVAARIWCNRKKIPYTTAYHTRFPEYFHEYHGIRSLGRYSWGGHLHNVTGRLAWNTSNFDCLNNLE